MEAKVKEFYFREKDGEIFFFFRDKKKSNITSESWKRNCDKVEIKENGNNTLEKLMSFLGMEDENRTEVTIDDISVTVWKNRGYRFTIICTGTASEAFAGSNKIYKLDLMEEK